MSVYEMSAPSPTDQSTAPFRFTRLRGSQKLRYQSLHDAIGVNDGREKWLFVSPHDDDVPLGAGLWMLAAADANVDVHVLVVTNGSQGYCTLEQRDSIEQIRRAETYESYEILGVQRNRVAYIGYPDG